MPYKRKYQKRPYRRRRRRIQKFNQKLSTYPLPLSFKNKIVYFDKEVVLNPTAGGLADTHVFSCNGVYDPDVSGVGHSPAGFATLSELYNHYTVIGSKLTVTFNNRDGTYPQLVGAFVSANTTEQVNPEDIIENGKGRNAFITTQSGSKQMATLTVKCPVGRFLGKKNLLSEDDCQGNAGSNPQEQCFFHVWAGPQEAVDTSPVYCTVRIEYICIWKEQIFQNV